MTMTMLCLRFFVALACNGMKTYSHNACAGAGADGCAFCVSIWNAQTPLSVAGAARRTGIPP